MTDGDKEFPLSRCYELLLDQEKRPPDAIYAAYYGEVHQIKKIAKILDVLRNRTVANTTFVGMNSLHAGGGKGAYCYLVEEAQMVSRLHKSYLSSVKLLIQGGAYVNGASPRHNHLAMAAEQGLSKAIKCLLEAGGDLNTIDTAIRDIMTIRNGTVYLSSYPQGDLQASNSTISVTTAGPMLSSTSSGVPETNVGVLHSESPGTQYSKVQSALLCVFDRMEEMNGRLMFDKPSLCAYMVLVLTCQFDCLIGLSGAIINEIARSTRAVIGILNETDVPTCASHYELVLQITGELVNVRDALCLVSKNLRNHAFSSETTKCNDSNATTSDSAGSTASSQVNISSTGHHSTDNFQRIDHEPSLSEMNSVENSFSAFHLGSPGSPQYEKPANVNEVGIGISNLKHEVQKPASGNGFVIKRSTGGVPKSDAGNVDGIYSSNLRIASPDEKKPERTTQVFVKDLLGKTISLQIELSKTIKELMMQIEDTGRSMLHQQLLFSYRRLDAESVLGKCGITRNSTIFICSELKGGVVTLLSNFLQNYQNNILRRELLPDNSREVVELSDTGYTTLRTLVREVVNSLDDGICWEGQLTLDRFTVDTNTGRVHVQDGGAIPATVTWVKRNLRDLADAISNYFYLPGVGPTPYLSDLLQLLRNPRLNGRTLEWIYKLRLLTNLAIVPSICRTNLILQLRIFFDELDGYLRYQFLRALSDRQYVAIVGDWTSVVGANVILEVTYNFRQGAYSATNKSAFDFIRNFFTHGIDNSDKGRLYNKRALGLELLIHEVFLCFIAEIIEFLLRRGINLERILRCCLEIM